MRILQNELMKIWGSRRVLAVIAFLLLFDGVLLWLYIDRQEIPAKAYRSLCADIRGIPQEKAYEELTRETDFLNDIFFGQMTAGSEDAKYRELYERYQEESYPKYSPYLYEEIRLYSLVAAELSDTVNYEAYLTEVQKTAERYGTVGLFTENNSYSQKNIKKTAKDYEKLQGTAPHFTASRGVYMALSFLPTELIGILFSVLTVVILLTREKEMKLLELTGATCQGRFPLITAKLVAAAVSTGVMILLLFLCNMLVACSQYGFPANSIWNEPLQSLCGYKATSLRISVGGFFFRLFFAKLGGYLVFVLLAAFLSVLFANSVEVYATLAAFIGIEGLLYLLIGNFSYLVNLKYLNVIAFANMQSCLRVYQNLNLFGIPVSYSILVSGLILAAGVGLCAATLLLYMRASSAGERFAALRRFGEWIRTKLDCRHSNLFRHEAYKILLTGKALILLAAVTIFLFLSYTPEREVFEDQEDVYYKEYLKVLQGRLTPEKEVYLDTEQQRFEGLQEKLQLAESSPAVLYGLYAQYGNEMKKYSALQKVMEYTEYLKETPGSAYVYSKGYERLFADRKQNSLLALAATVLCIACLGSVMAIEYQSGVKVLQKSAFRGHMPVLVRKAVLSAGIVFVIYSLIYLMFLYNILHAYGTAGLEYQANSIQLLHGIPSGVSIGMYLLLLFILRLAGLLVVMGITFLMARFTKSYIYTLLGAFGVCCLPLFFVLLGYDGFRLLLLNLFFC